MERYDIYFGDFPYEDSDAFKGRPILILDDKKVAIIGSKITKTNDPKHYIKLEDWEEEGLKIPSYVQITLQREVPKDQIYFKVGHLSDADIATIEKNLNLEESLFTEAKDVDDLTDEDIFDMMYGKITVDGELYTKDVHGETTSTRANPGAGYDVSQVFQGINSKGVDCIEVSAKSREELDKAIEVADHYDCEYELKKNNKYAKFPYSVLIDYGSADLEKLTAESKLLGTPDVTDKEITADKEEVVKKAESLTEASAIKVSVYNFRPTTEEGRVIYSKISEAGKLGNLQDMLEQMYPDEEEINADEMNRLLSEKSSWVLDMLDIHDEIED